MAVYDFLDGDIILAYTRIQWNGINLPRERILNFISTSSITIVDNPGNSSTDITFAANLEALAAFNTDGILVYTGSNTFAARTITGTAGTITVTNGSGVAGNPTITIDATYPGQVSITTVGTITTGTWHGNIITGEYGGTGVNNGTNTITIGGNIVTQGALALSGAFPVTFTFTNNTSVTFPTSGTLATTSQLPTLPLPIADGGTGQTTQTSAFNALSPCTTKGDIIVYNGTDNIRLAVGTDNYVLTADATEPSGVKWGPASGSSAYETIQSGGVSVTQRAIANFVGSSVAITDDAPNLRTNITFATALEQIVANTWAGATSITTLGTIATGTWQGSVLASTYGGTGVNNSGSTITIGGNLTFSGAFTTSFTVTGNTSVTLPTSGTLATTSQLPSLPLSLSDGGTGASLTANNGGIFYSNGSTGAILAGTATANQILMSGSSSAPSWSTTTYPATTNQGDIVYASANNTISTLAKDANATRYLSNTGSSNNPAWAQVDVTNGVTGALPIANGGTGQTTQTAAFNALSPLTTQGDIIYYNGTNNVRLGPGTSGQVLSTQGAGANPQWIDGGGALIHIASATASSSSEIVFTDLTDADAIYVLYYSDVSITDELRLALSDDNGSTYALDFRTQSISASNTSVSAVQATGITYTILSIAGVINNGIVQIFRPYANTYTAGFSQTLAGQTTLAVTLRHNTFKEASTAQIDAFKVYPASGNISTGQFDLYKITN